MGIRELGLIAVLLTSTSTFSQSVLPTELEGEFKFTRFDGSGPGTGPISARIERQMPDGTFTGLFTFTARICRPNNAPMTGTFDGKTLRIEIPEFGICGKGIFTLKKVPNKNEFEGEYEISKSPTPPSVGKAQAWLRYK